MTYELFYSFGGSSGHGGPYTALSEARQRAREMLAGCNSMHSVEIRPRMGAGIGGYGKAVETVTRDMLTPDGVEPGIQILDIRIHSIQPSPNEGEVLAGVCSILGVEHHAKFVRVHEVHEEDERESGTFQEPISDVYGLYDEIRRINDGGRFATVKLPGFEGEYVMVIYPFCD